MTDLEEVLRELSRESGRALAELGVRPEDEKWIVEHARTIASLAGGKAARRDDGGLGRVGAFLYRLARRAARTAR
jgi:hypothetical protein